METFKSENPFSKINPFQQDNKNKDNKDNTLNKLIEIIKDKDLKTLLEYQILIDKKLKEFK